VQPRAVVRHLPGERAHAEGEQERQGEHDRGVAEGEPEAHRERPPAARRAAVGEQLAGGVVHRGDVVGVEGVPQAEAVGQQADADAEHLAVAEAQVGRGDRAEEDAEAHDVQQHDDGAHRQQGDPLGPVQRGPEGGGAAGAGSLDGSLHGHAGPPGRADGTCSDRNGHRELVAKRSHQGRLRNTAGTRCGDTRAGVHRPETAARRRRKQEGGSVCDDPLPVLRTPL
jgi:hypothetical protein